MDSLVKPSLAEKINFIKLVYLNVHYKRVYEWN